MTGTDSAERSADALAAPARAALRRTRAWGRVRFLASWLLALTLVAVALPRTVDVSWHGVLPVLRAVHWPALLALVGLWLLGLVVHSFVLTAAAPALTHRRALTLNVTGSAVANVVPLGGAAGVELNRRMMRAWGIDTRSFTGYTFLTNLWDVGSKLLLPIIGVIVLARAGETVTPQLKTMSLLAGAAFAGLATFAAVLLLSVRGTGLLGHAIEQTLRFGLRLIGRDRTLGIPDLLNDVRRECAGLVASGWVRMTAGICGYVALQWLLLGFCLQLTGAGTTWPEVLAGFAVERLFTIVPLTPGGVGVADLGLVGVLLTLGGDPAGVTAAAVLYRLFIFAVEIPVGGGVLGIWFLAQRRIPEPANGSVRSISPIRRIAHVTDVFLPRLGGIETHVDDLVRHQRSRPRRPRAHPHRRQRPRPGVGASHTRRWGAQRRHRVRRRPHPHLHVVSLWRGRCPRRDGCRHPHPDHRALDVGRCRRPPPAGRPHLAPPLARRLVRGQHCRGRDLPPVAGQRRRRRPTQRDRRRRLAALPASPAVRGDSHSRCAAHHVGERHAAHAPQTPASTAQDVRRDPPSPSRPRPEARHRRRRAAAPANRTLRSTPRTLPACADHRPDSAKRSTRRAARFVDLYRPITQGIVRNRRTRGTLHRPARRRDGVSEFIRDRVDGMLVANDTEMVVAIADLVTDRALLDRIRRHNHRVAPRHDWSDILEHTEALYRHAARRVGSCTPVAEPTAAPVAAGA